MAGGRFQDLSNVLDITAHINEKLVGNGMQIRVIRVDMSRLCPLVIKVWCDAKGTRPRCQGCVMLERNGIWETRMTEDTYNRIPLFLNPSRLGFVGKVGHLAGVSRGMCRTWRYKVTEWTDVYPVLVQFRMSEFYVYYIGKVKLEPYRT